MANLILSATLVVAFFMCISAYILGLKHGRQLANGQIPKLDINPVKAVTEAVESRKQKTEQAKVEAELADIMSCSQETMLKAIRLESTR